MRSAPAGSLEETFRNAGSAGLRFCCCPWLHPSASIVVALIIIISGRQIIRLCKGMCMTHVHPCHKPCLECHTCHAFAGTSRVHRVVSCHHCQHSRNCINMCSNAAELAVCRKCTEAWRKALVLLFLQPHMSRNFVACRCASTASRMGQLHSPPSPRAEWCAATVIRMAR